MKLKPLISISFSILLFVARGQTSPSFTLKDSVFTVGSIMRTPGTENFVWNPDKIQFTLDRAEILPQSFPYLDSVTAFLKKNKKLVIQVTRVQYEQPHRSYYTGIARAREVLQYLRSKGIDSIRLYASVLNQRYPVVSALELAKKPDEEYKNRFTEFKIIRCDGSYAPVGSFNWTDTSFTVGAKRRICIQWNLDSSGIREESKKVCDTVVGFMRKNPLLKIGIYVHTDSQGQLRHNLVLSNARAQSIVDYMRYKGIDSARIVPKGMASTQPLPGCDAASIAKMKTKEEKMAAYQADRRTEVVILATDYHAIK